MNLRISALIALALAAVAAFAAGDPDEALAAINKYRLDTVTKARETGARLDVEALQEKVKAMAEEAIKGVKPSDVEAEKAYSWAQLFNIAEKYEDIHMLCEIYQTSKPTEQMSFNAHMLCLRAFSQLESFSMGIDTLKEMPLPTVGNAYAVASMAADVFAPGVAKEKGFAAAHKLLDDFAARLPLSAEGEKDQNALDMARATLVAGHGSLIGEEKGVAEAVKFFDEKIAAETNPAVKKSLTSAARSMKAEVTRAALIGADAPIFPVERAIGEFSDFASLKGKVVIIDFFAHWCGPCIASFPDMRKMYDELKSQGLEVVGATTYYGYYKSENVAKRDMDKDTEIARMKDFMKEHGLVWPVVYSDRSLFDVYGVTGIPTTFVIGKDGKVRSFHIGYSPAEFTKFREEIEKLLKEGA